MENGKGKNSKQDFKESLRIQLIKHPELKWMTRQCVEEFEIAYTTYEIEVKASKTGKPITKPECVSRSVREIMVMENGCAYRDVTDRMILDAMTKAKKEDTDGIRVDLNKIFKGLKMEGPKHPSEISRKYLEYMERIARRKNEYGLNERFLSDEDKEIRKQCFPAIINGLWPETGAIYLKKKWLHDGKKWTMGELFQEMRDIVTMLGTIELMTLKKEYDEKTRGKRDDWKRPSQDTRYKPNGNNKDWVKRKKMKRHQGSESNKKEARKEETKIGTKENPICYRCGTPGHMKPDCFLADDHPKVKTMTKKWKDKRGLKRMGEMEQTNMTESSQDTSDEYEVDSDST